MAGGGAPSQLLNGEHMDLTNVTLEEVADISELPFGLDINHNNLHQNQEFQLPQQFQLQQQQQQQQPFQQSPQHHGPLQQLQLQQPETPQQLQLQQPGALQHDMQLQEHGVPESPQLQLQQQQQAQLQEYQPPQSGLMELQSIPAASTQVKATVTLFPALPPTTSSTCTSLSEQELLSKHRLNYPQNPVPSTSGVGLPWTGGLTQQKPKSEWYPPVSCTTTSLSPQNDSVVCGGINSGVHGLYQAPRQSRAQWAPLRPPSETAGACRNIITSSRSKITVIPRTRHSSIPATVTGFGQISPGYAPRSCTTTRAESARETVSRMMVGLSTTPTTVAPAAAVPSTSTAPGGATAVASCLTGGARRRPARTEEEKTERRKAQNRKAAEKLRQKTKRKNEKTEKDFERLTTENAEIGDEIDKLKQEKEQLQQILDMINAKCKVDHSRS